MRGHDEGRSFHAQRACLLFGLASGASCARSECHSERGHALPENVEALVTMPWRWSCQISEGRQRSWTTALSYGKSSTQIVGDRLGRNYVAVEYGEGRGTLAVTTYLLIDHLDGSNLNESAQVPILWTTGFRWKLDIRILIRSTAIGRPPGHLPSAGKW
jgi:hypothetical protein